MISLITFAYLVLIISQKSEFVVGGSSVSEGENIGLCSNKIPSLKLKADDGQEVKNVRLQDTVDVRSCFRGGGVKLEGEEKALGGDICGGKGRDNDRVVYGGGEDAGGEDGWAGSSGFVGIILAASVAMIIFMWDIIQRLCKMASTARDVSRCHCLQISITVPPFLF